MSREQLATILTVAAIIGIPITMWGLWRGIRGFVHFTDTAQRVMDKLDRETRTNGATHAAQRISAVLSSTQEPSIKDLLSSILVTNTQLLEAMRNHDHAAALRSGQIVASVDRMAEEHREDHGPTA